MAEGNIVFEAYRYTNPNDRIIDERGSEPTLIPVAEMISLDWTFGLLGPKQPVNNAWRQRLFQLPKPQNHPYCDMWVGRGTSNRYSFCDILHSNIYWPEAFDYVVPGAEALVRVQLELPILQYIAHDQCCFDESSLELRSLEATLVLTHEELDIEYAWESEPIFKWREGRFTGTNVSQRMYPYADAIPHHFYGGTGE
jgi:hypothetical protein